MQNVPDVLAEHQSIMLENFEATYIFNKWDSAFHEPVIHCRFSRIVPFQPNDRSLWDSSLIPSIPLQKLFCRLKLALYTCRKFILVVFVLEYIC